MIEAIKKKASELVITIIASVCASLLVGALTTYYTNLMMTEKLTSKVEVLEQDVRGSRLVERTAHLEKQIERHEKALDRDFARHEATVADIAHKTDDQEKRLTRLEALFTETQALLSEIRTDVKILLRGGQQ